MIDFFFQIPYVFFFDQHNRIFFSKLLYNKSKKKTIIVEYFSRDYHTTNQRRKYTYTLFCSLLNSYSLYVFLPMYSNSILYTFVDSKIIPYKEKKNLRQLKRGMLTPSKFLTFRVWHTDKQVSVIYPNTFLPFTKSYFLVLSVIVY